MECLRASRKCKTSGSTDPTDLASYGEEEDDGSMKLKEPRTSAEISRLARR